MKFKELLHINVFGSNVGVLTLFEKEEKDNRLTIFKFDGKGSFQLTENITDFKKSKIESLHTVVVNYISDINSIRYFEKNDPVEMSLLDKINNDHTVVNSIDIEERIAVTTIMVDDLNLLITKKKGLIKDHHFEAFNYLGLEVLKFRIPSLWMSASEQFKFSEQILLNDEKHDKLSLNALGVLAGYLLFDCIQSSKELVHKTNVIKSFTKRFLYKVVPVVLIVLIGNYFYFNSLNDKLFQIQQEISSVQNIIGNEEIKNQKSNVELTYINSLYYPSSLNRPYILNELLDAHVIGIIYESITIDPRPKDREIGLNYGESILRFNTKDSSKISDWLENIKSIDLIESVSLNTLGKNYKGLSEGEVIVKYKL
jgi:hypothetical protein